MKEKHFWGWPVAGYLFLGGLGGGMMMVSAGADLFFDMGAVFVLGNFVAAAALGIGSGLLVFELGRPFQFWRVFSKQKAVMTFGAWMLGILIVVSFLSGALWVAELYWTGFPVLTQVFAWLGLLLGLGVLIYTGILLGSLRARQFWNSAALPVLFFVSGLSTGFAAQSLLVGLWPWVGESEALTEVHHILHFSDMALMVVEIVLIFVYLLMMYGAGSAVAKSAAQSWLSGNKRFAFWFGLIGVGLVIPFVLYNLGGAFGSLAAICVLVGGLVLRFLVVYSSERQSLPGEEAYRSRLPKGDEEFLKVLK